MYIHRVKENECLMDIAEEYNVNPTVIASVNGLDIGSKLTQGQEVLILVPTRTVNISRGQSLDEVCLRFGVSEDEIIANNPILGGRKKVYEGQMLCIRYSSPSLGMAVRNGYIYSGCSAATLSEKICYTTIITLCSAVWRGGRLYILFDDDWAYKMAKKRSKRCFVRIYITEPVNQEGEEGLLRAIQILAANEKYDGVTLGGVSHIERKDELLSELHNALIKIKKELYIEGAAGDDLSYLEQTDGGIISYDKINLESIPSFAEGERAAYQDFASRNDAYKCYIDLSSFAYGDGKFVEKERVIRAASAKGAMFIHDDDRLISEVTIGGRRATKYVFESLKNQKAKLELASEFGFCGISFDLARIGIAELMMIRTCFSNPYEFDSPTELSCTGQKR